MKGDDRDYCESTQTLDVQTETQLLGHSFLRSVTDDGQHHGFRTRFVADG